MVGVVLVQPGTEGYARLEAASTGAAARAFFSESLAALAPYLRDEEMSRFALRPIARLPPFQLVEGDIHAVTTSGGVVLLGDAIKAVKPYFGQVETISMILLYCIVFFCIILYRPPSSTSGRWAPRTPTTHAGAAPRLPPHGPQAPTLRVPHRSP